MANNSKKIFFRAAKKADLELLRAWFNKSHVKKYWDNSTEMWENVESYLSGNKVLYDYWIGLYENISFSLIITSDASENDPEAPGCNNSLLPFVEPIGKTWTIDFMIGEEAFLGKGLSYLTLNEFTENQEEVTAFLIDPEISNLKAIHVYEKAGFEKVGSYTPDSGYFSGIEHLLMKKKVEGFRYYPMCRENIEDFIPLAFALWPHESQDFWKKEFYRILNSQNETGFICKKNGESVGFITMGLRFEYVPKAKTRPVGFIEGIYVKDQYRKRGVARKLYDLGENWVKAKGCTEMASDTWDWNTNSILFHEKLGFDKAVFVHFIKKI